MGRYSDVKVGTFNSIMVMPIIPIPANNESVEQPAIVLTIPSIYEIDELSAIITVME